MSHQLTTTLSWLGYYMAFGVWLLLLLLFVIGLIRKRWSLVTRISKFLINSSVFLFAYFFYLDIALIVRPPGSEPELRAWVNQNVTHYLYISFIVTAVLLGLNYLFYKRVEKQRHKADLFILATLDIIVLLCGAWIQGKMHIMDY